MDVSLKKSTALAAAATRILTPLIRVLLRNGVSFQSFAEISKRAYVNVAMNDFGIPGRKPSASRVAILTGLTRKEIQRLTATGQPSDPEGAERYNRAARVVAGWVRDREFNGPDGEPLALAADGAAPSFAELVRRHGGDVPARAVLDELLRVGAVERDPADGRIRLLERAYIPRTSDLDKVEILGSDASDLIDTIDHNMRQGGSDPRFQRKVMYDNLPAEVIPKFRELSAARGQELLELLDRWLSERDRDVNPSQQGSGRVRAGIGIYYFEEDLSHEQEES
jgi:hypothetical protein